MKNFRRIVAVLLLIAVLCIIFIGCSKNENTDSKDIIGFSDTSKFGNSLVRIDNYDRYEYDYVYMDEPTAKWNFDNGYITGCDVYPSKNGLYKMITPVSYSVINNDTIRFTRTNGFTYTFHIQERIKVESSNELVIFSINEITSSITDEQSKEYFLIPESLIDWSKEVEITINEYGNKVYKVHLK